MMIISRTPTLRRLAGRKMRRYVATRQQSREDRGRDEHGVEVEAERLTQPDREVGTERQRFRVGDVDEAGQPVDEREPDGREDQRSLLHEADDERLSDELHQRPLRDRGSARVLSLARLRSHDSIIRSCPYPVTRVSLASNPRTRWATRSAERPYMSSSSSSLADSV